MEEQKIIFDADNWLAFLAQFNPVAEHSWLRKFERLREIETWGPEILHRTAMYYQSRGTAKPQEEIPTPLAHNLGNIYGDSADMIWDYINAYRNTQDRIVRGYVDIDGLDQLFSACYFHFEWMMHVDLDFDRGKGNMYRDHFLHQTKNAWMGYVYLHQMGWMGKIIQWMEDYPTNTIVRYVNDMIEKEINYRLTARDDAGETFEDTVNLYREMILDSDKEVPEESIEDRREAIALTLENELYIQDGEGFLKKCGTAPQEANRILMKQLIRFELVQTTWFIAALLHDIGYPVQFIRRQQKQIVRFMPTMEWPSIADEDSFNGLKRLLGSSLLFKVIQEEDLRGDYMHDKHGTISALVMLNHFYHQGTVHEFSPLKQCAIDWAAVCIQQHTQKFQASTEKDKDRYLVDRFENNGLGFLLRMVDDLQEFDRFYYYIGQNHAMLFCNTCNMPMVPKDEFSLRMTATSEERELVRHASSMETIARMRIRPRELSKRGWDSGAEERKVLHSRQGYMKPRAYHCGCMPCPASDGETKYDVSKEYTSNVLYPVAQCRTFDYRRINTLIACRRLTIYPDPMTKSFRSGQIHTIQMEYDDWAMLMILQMSPVFAMQRMGDLNQLKRMLWGQRTLPGQMICCFLSANPVWIKVDILYHFLRDNGMLSVEEAKLKTGNRDLAKDIWDKIDPLLRETWLGQGQCNHCETANCSYGSRVGTYETFVHILWRANKKEIMEKLSGSSKEITIDCPKVWTALRMAWRMICFYVPMLVLYYRIYGAEMDSLDDETRKSGEMDIREAQQYCKKSIRKAAFFCTSQNQQEAFYLGEHFAEHAMFMLYTDPGRHYYSFQMGDQLYLHQFERKDDSLKAKQESQEKLIRIVADYVRDEAYRPELAFQKEQGRYQCTDEWFEIDYMSDLKMFYHAHQYSRFQREQEEYQAQLSSREYADPC